jgi:hypothetical protein
LSCRGILGQAAPPLGGTPTIVQRNGHDVRDAVLAR